MSFDASSFSLGERMISSSTASEGCRMKRSPMLGHSTRPRVGVYEAHARPNAVLCLALFEHIDELTWK